MELYLALSYREPRQLVTLAPVVERLGYDGVSVPDHVAVMEESGRYPYTEDGGPPFPVDAPWPDLWVTFAAMAAVTERLRFLSHVYVLPLRHPVHVAKSVAAAAIVSDDRILMGVGVGSQRDEFALVGESFATRGARTEEAIALMRACWTQQPLRFEGSHYRVPGAFVEPRPARPVPILIGGESEAAIDRAVRLADGFVAVPHTVDDTVALVAMLRRRLAEAGRGDAPFHINVDCTDVAGPADIARLELAGATSLLVRALPSPPPAGSTVDDAVASLEHHAATTLAGWRG